MSKTRPQRFALRIMRINDTGCLVPADGITQARMRERGYATGDLVFAEIKKPRNPKFHRLMHALGGLATESLDEFSGMGAHAVLKRLQLEAGVGCEEVAYKIDGELIVQRIPLSLSFESMDEGEFHEVAGAIAHRLTHYWPDCTADEIWGMAEEWQARAA